MKPARVLIVVFCLCSCQVFSQWFWQNPKPQGNTLQSICFVNTQEGWACGYHGTIIHTGDGGLTWEIQANNSPWWPLNDIFFIDPMHGWAAGSYPDSFMVLLKTTDGGMNWETQICIPTNSPLRGIFFMDADTGWVVGSSGKVISTTDGGLTWWNNMIPPEVTTRSLASVVFRGNHEGWIVGSNGTILKNPDGGFSWATTTSPTTKSLNCISFSSDLNGTICGDQGTILLTQNGGATWTELSSGTTEDLARVSFASPDTGIITGNVLLKTVDGGLTWQILDPYPPFHNGCMPGNLTAYGTGGNGRLEKSNDGGITWYELSHGTNGYSIRDSWFLDENHGWLRADCHITLYTDDGGDHWQIIDSSNYCTDAIMFTDPLNGWASGFPGVIHTSDGGHSWNLQFNSSESMLSLQDVFFTDPGHGWATGFDTVLRTTDGGLNWDRIKIDTIFSYGVFFIDQTTGWIVGSGGKILKSTDGGLTWMAKPSGTDADLHGITFVGPDKGWAVGKTWASSVVLRTTDGGESWEYQELPMGQDLFSVSFPDSLNGWVSGSNGYVFHTQDGGITWEQQANLTDNYLFSVFFVNQYTGWTVGSGGTILKTTNGGLVGVKPHEIPENKGILTVFPNPAGSASTISYCLHASSAVRLILCDISGHTVKEIVNSCQPVGNYKKTLDVSGLSQGIYFCKIQTRDYSETKKIIVLK